MNYEVNWNTEGTVEKPAVYETPYETFEIDTSLVIEAKPDPIYAYWRACGPWADILVPGELYDAVNEYSIDELINQGLDVYGIIYEPYGLSDDVFIQEQLLKSRIVKIADTDRSFRYIPRANIALISIPSADQAAYIPENIAEEDIIHAPYPKVGAFGLFTASGPYKQSLNYDVIYTCIKIELIEEICSDRESWLFSNYYDAFNLTQIDLDEDKNNSEVLVTLQDEIGNEISILGAYIHTDVGGDSNGTGSPSRSVISTPSNPTPRISSKGIYTATGPFAHLLNPQLSYECISVETINGLIANGINVFTEVYEQNGLSEYEMIAYADNGGSISTLQGSNGSIVKIPTNYLNTIPNANGVKYSCIMLGISLSALPDDFDLTQIKDDVSNLIFSRIGVRSEVKSLVFGATSLISQEEHRSIESARNALITNTQTSISENEELRMQNTLLINKVDQLENYIKTTL